MTKRAWWPIGPSGCGGKNLNPSTLIEAWAFASTALTEVKLTGVKEIGDFAFASTELEKVELLGKLMVILLVITQLTIKMVNTNLST